ncbi:hypothetical protein D3C80_780460 [compost metagenome]
MILYKGIVLDQDIVIVLITIVNVISFIIDCNFIRNPLLFAAFELVEPVHCKDLCFIQLAWDRGIIIPGIIGRKEMRCILVAIRYEFGSSNWFLEGSASGIVNGRFSRLRSLSCNQYYTESPPCAIDCSRGSVF